MAERTDEQSETTRVYAALRGDIIEGRIPAGTRLVERTVGDEQGVSRLPVREAIRRLAAERLVERIPNAGAVVSALTRSDIADLNEVHHAFDRLVVREAALRRTEDDLPGLREPVDAFAEAYAALDRPRMTELALRFRARSIEATHNQVLRQVNTRYEARIMYLLRLPLREDAATSLADLELETYQTMYAGYEARDPDAAEGAFVRFLGGLRAARTDRDLAQLRSAAPAAATTTSAAGNPR